MLARRGLSLVVTLSCAGGALLPTAASAAGFLFYEVGTPEVGFASAGYVTRAASPSTLLTNPAGMTRLEGTQVQVGSELVYGHLQFAPDSRTDPVLGKNDGGNAVGLLPSGGVFATFAPWREVRLGVGVFTNFGAPESWDPAWLGRYYTTKTTLIGISIMPGVAWRISEALSIGATVNVMSGHLRQRVAIQNLEGQATDGSLEVSSDTWGVGGNVGLLYALSPATRLGITYTSPVKLNFSSAPVFAGLGPGIGGVIRLAGLDTATVDLGMKVPQTVMLGFYQAIDERWAIVGDVGWQNWAAFGAVEIGITTDVPRGLTTQINYQDTWHVALGAQVQLSEPWQLNFGIAYDSSMTDDANRSLSLALANQLRFGIGAQVAVDRHWNLGLASELLWDGSPTIDVDRGPLAGHVSGSYANTWIFFVAFSFTWKA
jgi:long-chain fatty acid transport protein